MYKKKEGNILINRVEEQYRPICIVDRLALAYLSYFVRIRFQTENDRSTVVDIPCRL